MRKPPDLKELEPCAGKPHKYDFTKAGQILEAMDFLRREAVTTRIEEIVTMIDATHSLLITTYYCILRYEMTKLAGNEMVQ
jgi:hypothetical protein